MFFERIWDLATDGFVFTKEKKDKFGQVLDEILRNGGITMDSAYHILTLMPKFNINKSISRQIIDFLINLIGESSDNMTCVNKFIRSYDAEEISKEETELYERFDETFHKQESIHSLIQVQSKGNEFISVLPKEINIIDLTSKN